MKYNSIAVIGPTAVGKTSLSAILADKFNGEIISVDSRQVYRGMDIGTGKDLEDYVIDNRQIPYHLIDIVNPDDEFNLFEFIISFNNAFDSIVNNNKTPFIVGGTGLFLHSLFKGYKLNRAEFDEKKFSELSSLSLDELRKRLIGSSKNPLHNTTDLVDKERIIKAILITESSERDIIEPRKIKLLIFCLMPDRKIIHTRIEKRLDERLKNGMIEEVEALINSGLSTKRLDLFGLEYRYVSLYLTGEINYNDMKQKLSSAIKRFAKRQITWIRKFEKEGIKMIYLENPDVEKASGIIEKEFFA